MTAWLTLIYRATGLRAVGGRLIFRHAKDLPVSVDFALRFCLRFPLDNADLVAHCLDGRFPRRVTEICFPHPLIVLYYKRTKKSRGF